MDYSTDKFFDYLYTQSQQSQETLMNCKEERLESLLEEKREGLRQVLKLRRYEEMAFNPVSTLQEQSSLGKLGLTRYDFTFLPNLTVPFWVLEPEQSNGRNMLYCHGHDEFGAKGSFWDFGKGYPYHKYLPLTLAEQGYRVFIPEFVGFGQVRKEQYREEDSRACYANSELLLLHGLNMAGLRVYEAMKALDFIQQKSPGLPTAVYGISGGGLVNTYLTALDRRVNASVIAGYGNTYQQSIMSVFHCVDNYTPEILSVGECPETIALAVPTPILMTNGLRDPIFPLTGSEQAVKDIQTVYRRFHCEARFEYELFDGEHEVSTARMFDFLTDAFKDGMS